MKKMTWKMRLLGGLVAVSMLFAGCAQGVDDETFSAGVSNAQLESPELNEDSFGVVTDVVTGNEVIQVKWPVVVGAEGYKFAATKTGRWLEGKLQPVTPEPVMFGEASEKEVEGCSTTFEGEYGCEYEVAITTIGNKKLNNQDALSAATYKYLYYTPPTFIPALDKNGNPTILDKVILASFDPARPKSRAVFLLEPDGQYQINGELSFGLHEVEIYPAVYNESKGDYDAVETHATITFGADEEAGTEGALLTATGLVLKNLNFDCSKSKLPLIQMDNSRTDVPLTKTGSMYCMTPITIEGCWVKNLKAAILSVGGAAWGVEEIIVSNSIIQCANAMDTDHDNTVFSFYAHKGTVNGVAEASWAGGAKHLRILNSTIYNTIKSQSSKSYFIRYTNAALDKVFGVQEGSVVFENSTLGRFIGKEFGNCVGRKNWHTISIKNTILWDIYRVWNEIKRGSKLDNANNVYGGTVKTDGDDKNFATQENGIFTEEAWTQVLDFSQPNGGVNFKATGTLSSTIGDPRWLN